LDVAHARRPENSRLTFQQEEPAEKKANGGDVTAIRELREHHEYWYGQADTGPLLALATPLQLQALHAIAVDVRAGVESAWLEGIDVPDPTALTEGPRPRFRDGGEDQPCRRVGTACCERRQSLGDPTWFRPSAAAWSTRGQSTTPQRPEAADRRPLGSRLVRDPEPKGGSPRALSLVLGPSGAALATQLPGPLGSQGSYSPRGRIDSTEDRRRSCSAER
jgi:hypothetical protein